MDESRIEELTEGQRACLRLTLRAMTSKEIGRELGISPHTVDQRLKVAIRLLGVSTRAEAARQLERYERDYQPLVYQPGAVAKAAGGSTMERMEWSAGTPPQLEVREERQPFVVPDGEVREAWLPFATRRRPNNELNITGRILWTIGLALLWIAILSLLAQTLSTFNRLYPAKPSGNLQTSRAEGSGLR